jgi:Rrf2 family transcriptional regulator, nitric oxide-sensitive transcriptional repressor
MRLAEYTDFTLRVLMYCAAHPERLTTIAEMADRHGVSKNHLMKIVNDLARQGIIETIRGRGGGLRLRKRPADIRVGDIVRNCETDFRLVECFDRRTNACSLISTCRLKGLFGSALQAYFSELDAATLADIAGLVPLAGGSAAASPGARNAASVIAPVTRRRAVAKPSPRT